MAQKRLSFIVSLLLLLLSISASAQTKGALPRSTPELQGVSSKGILSFLDAAGKSRHEFHSFMFLRHGKVIAEGWWKPYGPELKHTMYSASKSFTSTAIGFAVSEKRLSVNDKVISFFPNELPDKISPYLSQLRVKDLLSMSVGMDPDPTFIRTTQDTNWVKAFLSKPIVNKPGTKFLYNTLGTYMLSAIVQKVTGQKLIDYLRPRLFNPLSINDMDWEVSPMGMNTGGWGLRIKTEDMSKFGQFYLQKGNWNGRQLLPEKWIKEATTSKIEQEPDATKSRKDSSDWMQGYCYQFWRCRNNGFRADGAYGQFIIVLPDEDAVIAITAETTDMQDEINLVWEYLLPAMHKNKLPADKNAENALKQKLSSLALPLPVTVSSKPFSALLSGKTAVMEPNEIKIQNISFLFNNDVCHVTLKTDRSAYSIAFGNSKWQMGETTKLGPSLVFKAKGHFAGLPPSKVAGSYCWKDENTLELTLRYIESPHTETMLCHFDQNKISVDIHNSNSSQNEKLTIKGKFLKSGI